MSNIHQTRYNAAGVVPDDEPLADILKRKEREISQQIAALRGALAPKERELENIRKAMAAIGLAGNVLTSIVREGEMATGIAPGGIETGTALPVGVASQLADAAAMFTLVRQTWSIKDMILNALRDHFHNGATPAELRDYFMNAYGREVDRNSISPTLARLRDQGAVVQSEGVADGKWRLTRAGKWYDHPTSFPDEGPDNDGIGAPVNDGVGPPVRDSVSPPATANSLFKRKKPKDDFLD